MKIFFSFFLRHRLGMYPAVGMLLLLLPGTLSPCYAQHTGGQTQPDDVYIRVYRDSVKYDSGRYVQVEARVINGQIIAVYVEGREIGPEDYDMYAGPLIAILQQEKELREKFIRVNREIISRQKERDSLAEAPWVVDSMLFYPGGDLEEQVRTVLEEKRERTQMPDDTLPQEPLLADGNEFHEMVMELFQLKTQREERIGQINRELMRLEEERLAITEALETIADKFSLVKENVQPPDQQKKTGKGRRNKKNKRRK